MKQKVNWKYLFIIAFVSLQAATHLYLSYRADRALIGFISAAHEGQGILVDEVSPDLPAEKAGLRPGDLIVAVDNNPVRSELNYDSIKLHDLVAGKPARFHVVRKDAAITLTITPYSSLQPVKFVTGVLLVLVCLTLGVFCYIKNPGDPRTRMLLLIFLSFAAVDSWITSSWFGDWPVDQLLTSLYFLADGFDYGLLTLLPFFIPERKQFLVRRPRLALLFLVPGLASAAFTIWNWELWIYQSGKEIISIDYLATFDDYQLNAIFLLTPLVVLHTLRNATSPQIRNQAKTMFFGVTCWAVLNSLVIAIQKIYPSSWLADDYYAAIVDIIIPISVFFAIYRHGLFDIDVLIRKGLVYTAVSSVLFSIYLLAIGSLGWLVAKFFESESSAGYLTNSLSTLLVGLAFIPVRRYSQRLIDRIFYREKFNYLEVINTIFDEMPAAFSLEKLVENLSGRIFAAMRIKNVAVLIPDEEHSRYFLRSKTGDFPGTDLENRVVFFGDDPLVLRLLETGNPIYGKALDHLPISGREEQALALLGSKLVMPVPHQKRLVAMLLLGEKQSETWFDGDDLSFLVTVSRQAAMLMENARLHELATYDGLTQLMRRSAFDAVLEAEIQRSGRYRRPLTLIMLDIDHFKKLNDTYGHQTGDLVLKKVAATLKASLRQTDIPSRYGGEEFSILLPEAGASSAEVVAENLRNRIETLELNVDETHTIRITASLGIFTAEGHELVPPEEMYRRADSALYLAKSSGRNRVESYAGPSHMAPPVL